MSKFLTMCLPNTSELHQLAHVEVMWTVAFKVELQPKIVACKQMKLLVLFAELPTTKRLTV